MNREETCLERARVAEQLGFDAEPFYDAVKLARLLDRHLGDTA